jgi:hypothetical protein
MPDAPPTKPNLTVTNERPVPPFWEEINRKRLSNGPRCGDWSGTPYNAIWVRCGYSELQAALFFGNLWKLRIIERADQWMGIRNDPTIRPTFPQKGITLQGKTYFRTGP